VAHTHGGRGSAFLCESPAFLARGMRLACRGGSSGGYNAKVLTMKRYVGCFIPALVLLCMAHVSEALLFSLNHADLPAEGEPVEVWGDFERGGGEPVTALLNGVKWLHNPVVFDHPDLPNQFPMLRHDGGVFSDPIPIDGATIVVAVKPLRHSFGGEPWNSIVDLFYDQLCIGISNQTGLVKVKVADSRGTNPTWTAPQGTAIPDGEAGVLSMTVTNRGAFTVYWKGEDGAERLIGTGQGAVADTYTQLTPGAGGRGYASYINIGRNNPDSWPVFNGYIGDTHVYGRMLSGPERATLVDQTWTAMGITGPGMMEGIVQWDKFHVLYGLTDYRISDSLIAASPSAFNWGTPGSWHGGSVPNAPGISVSTEGYGATTVWIDGQYRVGNLYSRSDDNALFFGDAGGKLIFDHPSGKSVWQLHSAKTRLPPYHCGFTAQVEAQSDLTLVTGANRSNDTASMLGGLLSGPGHITFALGHFDTTSERYFRLGMAGPNTYSGGTTIQHASRVEGIGTGDFGWGRIQVDALSGRAFGTGDVTLDATGMPSGGEGDLPGLVVRFSASDVMDPRAALTVTHAGNTAIVLPQGTRSHVYRLKIDGLPMPVGEWGSEENEALDPLFRHALFRGLGTVVVLDQEVLPVPLAPEAITYPSTNASGYYMVSWSPSEWATSYRVDRSPDSGTTWSEAVYLGRAAGFMEIVDDGTYRYRVTAVNASGESPFLTGGHDCVVDPHNTDETLGRSSRHTGMVISEIMHAPPPRDDDRVLEYIELYNSELLPQDLGGWRLAGAIDYVFPRGTTLAPQAFLVVARSAADVGAVYGTGNVAGDYVGSLATDEGVVQLIHRNGAVLLEAAYASSAPWPAAAAGAGHSLVLGRPSYGEGSAEAWRASTFKGGSPGAMDPPGRGLLRHVRINEFLAHTDLPLIDYIELYNTSTSQVDLSGAFLSDKPHENRFRIPDGTLIGPGGHVVFYEDQLGFALDAAGEAIYLVDPDNTRVIDAVRFGAQINGVSTGRYPDGGDPFYPLATLTPGAPNGPRRPSAVVINEIMFNPISGLDEDTYIELHNRSGETVDLSDWRLLDGIRFEIPQGTLIPPGGYLVVARDKARLMSRYADLSPANTLGDFSGRLSNSGERIALAMPVPRTLAPTGYAVVEEVTYRDGGRWGQWANRDGSSLELIDPRSNTRLAANWTHSDERHKSAWTRIEHTGVLDNGARDANELHLLLPSSGICLIDNVEVFAEGGTNQVPNGTFESGISGWIAQGNHVYSRWHTAEGFNSSRSLLLEATGGGDNGANRVKIKLNTTFQPGQVVTIRARARWLAGHPDVILRLKGNYLEAVGTMPLPEELGTPGRRNSVYAANTGPAIHSVRQFPALPQSGQPVLITAQACDPDGVSAMVLRYRMDPSPTFTTVEMRDDGEDGDAVAGDGIFTATIPGQADGTLIAYHVMATDGLAVSSTYPEDISEYEPLVRIGESDPPGSLPVYRMWFTKATLDEWTQREQLSNQRLPGTLVYGSRVIHNIGARYRGSPWIRPQYTSPIGPPSGFAGITAYSFQVPRDDRLLGAREFNLDGLEQPDRDNTLQREKMTYWIAEQLGTPFSHLTYLHVILNGVRRGVIYTDSQHVDSAYLQSWFPEDNEGEIFKIDDWFEFNDNVTFEYVTDAQLLDYTTTGGVKKQARYRWSWIKRSNRGLNDDYSQLFQLVDAVHVADPAAYVQAVEALVDVDQWMRVFAVRRIAGDWDGYGYARGKNGWTYKPEHDRWKMIPWDLDHVLGGASRAPTASLFTETNCPSIRRMYDTPPFRRAYLQAFHDMVYGGFHPDLMGQIMDARHAMFLDQGLSVNNPAAVTTWIADRRAYVIGVLDSEVPDVFAITTNDGQDFSTDNPWLMLEGVAPLDVKDLTFNGLRVAVQWTSAAAWRVMLPLQTGANTVQVQGWHGPDEPVDGAEASITVTFTGDPADPDAHLVINEIMYHPTAPDAEFVEIHNTSATHGFDLTGYRLRGIDFNFADGTLIEPQGYLVVANDLFAFHAAYGSAIPVAGEYTGRLHPEGERLQLVRLATATEEERIIDEVTYGVAPPWPPSANGQGPSLQRIDPHQDSTHPGNWAAVPGNGPDTEPVWQFVTLTGVTHPSSPSDRIYIYLHSAGEFHIDDLFLAQGTTPQAGPNHLVNGGFEAPLDGSWTVSPNHEGSAVTSSVKHSGNHSLHVVATSGGTTRSSSIWQDGLALVPGEVYTLSYWYLPDPNGATLTIRLRYANDTQDGINSTHSVRPDEAATIQYTPGARNSVLTTLPPFPPLWLNEVQPVNTGEHTDRFGQASPWVEVYNAGPETISLADYSLSDTYTQLGRWMFPSGADIGPGAFRMVWLDGRPEQTTDEEWHAHFTIDPDAGTLYLSRRVNTIDALVDALSYDAVPPGLSYGRYPDGSPEMMKVLYTPSPGQENLSAGMPLLHYWHFNDLVDGILTAVSADYSAIGGALITYPGSGAGYMDRVADGSPLNAQMLQPPGAALRARNPSDSRMLLIALPTTGYEDVLLAYAACRTTNGAQEQTLLYQLGEGSPWVPHGEPRPVTEDYQRFEYDFSGIAGTSNNPGFAVAILFSGTNAPGLSGNNRFDNITLSGLPIAGTNLPPQPVAPVPLQDLVEGSAAAEIDLGPLFTDPDGDALAFTAQSDDPAVVAVTVDGASLTLTPLQRGDATVTVTADDGHNPPVPMTFRVLVHPAAHPLAGGPFTFGAWSPDEPAGRFPAHMLFLQGTGNDALIDTPLEHAYRIPPADEATPGDANFPYRATARTRINGLGNDGIAFINTGRGRDLGGALLALDTRGVDTAPVGWLGGTVLPNLRVYAIRLQYRIGTSGPFSDVLDGDGQPVEYVRNGTAGHAQPIGPVALPAATLDQAYVQLLWRYYLVADDSGARAQLRLDEIVVANREAGAATRLAFDASPPPFWQSGQPLPPFTVRALSADGFTDAGFTGTVSLDLGGDGLLAGTLAVDAVDGVATFADVALSGTGLYRLGASAAPLHPALSDEVSLARVTGLLVPQYIQGEQDALGENLVRVPYAYRARIDGLRPLATYRYGNRVASVEDAPLQDGAGNMILVTGPASAWIRNTSAPRFLDADLGVLHHTFTTDAAGSYTGWFVTEPSGNARFTPGHTVHPRILLNDGQDGEALQHVLALADEVTVIRLGEAPGEATAVMGQSAAPARNFVLLYGDTEGASRPLAGVQVEITGSEIDERYAPFYRQVVAVTEDFWGTLIPNTLPTGVRRVEWRSLDDGALLAAATDPGGFPGTVEPASGLDAVTVDAAGSVPRGYAAWQHAHFTEAERGDPGISGPLADPVDSGVANLLRYALGLGRHDSYLEALPETGTAEGTPRFLHRRLRSAESGILYIIELSPGLTDPAAWKETVDGVDIHPVRITDTGDGLTDLVEYHVTPAGAPRRFFLRLRIDLVD